MKPSSIPLQRRGIPKTGLSILSHIILYRTLIFSILSNTTINLSNIWFILLNKLNLNYNLNITKYFTVPRILAVIMKTNLHSFPNTAWGTETESPQSRFFGGARTCSELPDRSFGVGHAPNKDILSFATLVLEVNFIIILITKRLKKM